MTRRRSISSTKRESSERRYEEPSEESREACGPGSIGTAYDAKTLSPRDKETVPTDSASVPLPDQPVPRACPATMRPFPAVPGHPGGVRVPRDPLSLQSGVRWERRFCSAPRDCTYTISGHLPPVKRGPQYSWPASRITSGEALRPGGVRAGAGGRAAANTLEKPLSQELTHHLQPHSIGTSIAVWQTPPARIFPTPRLALLSGGGAGHSTQS